MSTDPGRSLDLSAANEIITLTLQQAATTGVPALSVIVVDPAGHLLAMQRQDGASMFRFDIALGKAWAAVAMGEPSRVLADRARDNPTFFTALASTGRGRFLPQPGAVLIRDRAGRLLGAAGASGGTGDQDEACCVAAVIGAGFRTEL